MATINAWPATETTKSNMLFGRFIRLFSSIPAERFAETVAFLGFFRPQTLGVPLQVAVLAHCFFQGLNSRFFHPFFSPFILLDAYLTH